MMLQLSIENDASLKSKLEEESQLLYLIVKKYTPIAKVWITKDVCHDLVLRVKTRQEQ